VFFHHDVSGPVELWFTDRRGGDLRVSDDLAVVRTSAGVDAMASMEQVHGDDVAWATDETSPHRVDALLTDRADLGLLVRVADCVPIVLAAPDDGLVGVVHCGRVGLVAGVVPAAVDALRQRGAGRLEAWVGPRACGRCYELPAEMADHVASVVPEARSTTSWGTPAADIGAGVAAQLIAGEADVHDIGADVCTIEDERFFSYRRQGAEAGRFGAVAVLRGAA
jgi:YfiH family protein